MCDYEVVKVLEDAFKSERMQDFRGKITVEYDFGAVKVEEVDAPMSEETRQELLEQIVDLKELNNTLENTNDRLLDDNEDLEDENRSMKRTLEDISRTAEEASY